MDWQRGAHQGRPMARTPRLDGIARRTGHRLANDGTDVRVGRRPVMPGSADSHHIAADGTLTIENCRRNIYV